MRNVEAIKNLACRLETLEIDFKEGLQIFSDGKMIKHQTPKLKPFLK